MTLDQEMQAGHAAQRFADAHRNMLADHCGVVDEPRSAVLIRHIATREGLLLRNTLTQKRRAELLEANELDEQELCIIEGRKGANETAADLARWILFGVVGGAVVLGLVHLAAVNWGL